MECLEPAFKPTTDDFTTVIGVTGDDFFVDGLLDFSDDGGFEEENDDTNVVLDTINDNNVSNVNNVGNVTNVINVPISTVITNNHHHTTAGFPIPETDLCLPADDVADLEWVSHFVDDSFSGGYSLPCPAGKLFDKKPEPKPEPEGVKPALTTPVLTKARSKRARTGGRIWSLVSSPATDSSTSSSSSSSYTSNPWMLFDSAQTAESVFGKPAVKRQKKRSLPVEPGVAVQPRRCSHCLVQKTPQWRAGPLGAKTLCNACGVRYKSGRLLPEYRPACSPTFSSDVHSNNHRKVLEMRQKKETAGVGTGAGAGLAFPVRSF